MYLSNLIIFVLSGFVSTYHFQSEESPLDASSAEAAVLLSIKRVLDRETVPAGLSDEYKANQAGMKSSAVAKFMKRLFEQYRNSEYKPEKGNMVRSILPKVGVYGLRTSLSFDLSGINVSERVIKANIYFRLDIKLFNRRFSGSGADSVLQRMPVAMATIDSSGVKSELPLLEDFGPWVSFDATKLVRKLMIEQYLIKVESYFGSNLNGKDGHQRPYARGYDISAGAPTFSVAFGYREFGDVHTFQVGKSLRRHEPFLLVYSDDSKTTPVDSLEEVDQLLNDFSEELDQKHGQQSKWTHQRVKRSLRPKDPSYYKYKSRSRQSRRHENLSRSISALGDRKFSSRVESAVVDTSHEGSTGKPEKTDPPCQKNSFFIDFGALGWDKWIISPSGFYQFQCVGSCANNSIQKSPNLERNHAIPDVPTPCCAPSKIGPLSIIYNDRNGNMLIVTFENMIVQECACSGDSNLGQIVS